MANQIGAGDLDATRRNALRDWTATASVRGLRGVWLLALLLVTAMGVWGQAPAISALAAPDGPSAVQNSGPVTLTVTGTGFVSGAMIVFGATDLDPTNFVSSTSLTAVIPNTLLQTAGPVTVTVRNPGDVISNGLQFNVTPAAPTLSTLNPAGAVAGSGDTPLTLTGTYFVSGAEVLFGGTPLPGTVTFISSTELQVSIPAANLTTAGTFPVAVRNPDAQTSGTVDFVVSNPVPVLSSVTPAVGTVNETLPQLELTGTSFVDTSQILFNGQALDTTLVNAQTLRATNVQLPATPGTVKVQVRNPGPPVQLSEERDFLVLGNLSITLLQPDTVLEGSPDLAMQITGTGFQVGATVNFGATTGLAASNVTPTQLTVVIPAAQLALRGTFNVSVQNLTGPASNTLPFLVDERILPSIMDVNPPSVTVGSGDTLLQVQTSSAGATPELRFGSDILPATLSGTIVSATIPASLLATVRDVEIRIRRTEDDQISLPATFRVLASGPSISQLNPSSAVVGSGATAITVTGANFVSGAVVRFGTVDLATTFDSANSLGAVIPQALLGTVQTVQITVRNPDGQISGPLPFAVELAAPSLTNIAPSSAVQNSPTFTMNVSGTSFQSGAVVRFGSVDLATSFVNSTSLTATVPAAQVTDPRTVNVTVRNPDGKVSGALAFTVTAAADSPTISSLTPDRIPAGSPATVLTLTGTNYVAGSRVVFRGTQLTPSASSATSLTVTVPAALLELAGIVQVLVTNPSGASSNTVEFTVQPAIATPTLTQLTPANAPLATVNLVLNVTGSNFATGAVLLFGSTVINPTSRTSTNIIAPIPPALLSTARVVTVTVRNPGGQLSNPLEFTIGDPTPPPPPGLEISVQNLPPGVVGIAYGPGGAGVSITVTGGTAPYTLDVATETVGQLLAAGFLVDRPNASTAGNPVTLRIHGTPTAAGQILVRVIARDGAGTELTRDLQLTVFASALQITPETLPSAVIGVPFQQQLAVTGLSPQEQTPPEGQPVVTWTLLNAPAGLTLSNSGLLSGTFPAVTQVSFQVRASTSLRQATKTYSLVVDELQPSISTTALPAATIGTAYSAEIQATGGTPGYTWQIGGITLPAGLSFEAASVTTATLRISGTPQPGADSRTFTLTVRDSLNRAASREFTLSVSAVPIPALSFAPIPNPAPREQRDVVLTLAQAYPLALSGVATITFTPNATNNADDPNVRFVVGTNGGRSATFQIAANSTAVVFPNASPQRVQTGTVAGTIRVRAAISGGGPVQEAEIVIPRSAPQILDLSLSRSGENFTVSLTGFSTPRDLNSVQFTFTAPAGSGLQTTQVTIPLAEAATTWYNSEPGRANGSSFRLTIPFTVQGGANPVQSVAVTLTNSVGSSASRSASF